MSYVFAQPQPQSTSTAMVPVRRTLGAARMRRAAVRRHQQALSGYLGQSSTPVQLAKTGATAGATAAVAMIPVVGPFIAPFVGLIGGLFTKHHAEAVAKEGQTLNLNTPNFLNAVVDTMNALNGGQISESDAMSRLDAAQSTYYSSVSGIIKKSGQCKPDAADHGDRLHTDGMSTCNAACSIGCRIIEPAIYNIKKLIQAGGGSYTVPETPNNGAIAGTPSFTVSYSRGSTGGVGGALTSPVGGVPLWMWVAGGGVVLVLLLMMMRRQ